MEAVMRKPAAAATSLAWFIAIGGTFGCLLRTCWTTGTFTSRCLNGGSRRPWARC